MRSLMRAVAQYCHRSRFGAWTAARCESYLNAYWNRSNFDFDEKGEHNLLANVVCEAVGRPPVILDVGANVGEYCRLVTRMRPDAVVHCFEVVPETTDTLRANVGSNSNVVVHDYGLSEGSREVSIYHIQGQSSGSSLEPLHRDHARVVRGQVRGGDEVFAELGVAGIDLLKIDVEGHELSVLRGFRNTLGQGRIRAVQFEYGITTLAARQTLADFYDLFEPLGFAIGRLYVDGVAFGPYQPARDESHVMGNYVAVSRVDSVLRDRLAIRKQS